MKRYLALTALLILVLASCSNENNVDPLDTSSSQVILDPEFIAEELVAQTGWPDADDQLRLPEGCGNILEIDREEVAPGIAHYSYVLKVGEGEYDNIKLHRVIKECSPYRPIRTCKNLFFQHGDAVGFAGMMLYGYLAPSVPDEESVAIYLAQNDVDVWGIDQNWQLVPAGVTDLEFMKYWGIPNQVENLDIALSVARFTRLITGGGPGKMILAGYSSGSWTGYAYVNFETQKKPQFRKVGGYIPVDTAFRTDFQPMIDVACYYKAQYQLMWDSGNYADQVAFVPVAYLAMTDPTGDSPIAPGYTNYLVAMLAGSATHALFPFTPWYHYLAGEFDEYGMPTGFQFRGEQAWLEFLINACTYEPFQFEMDYLRTVCGEEVPWDDHLMDVTVPIFNVGAAGGFGNLSEYTLGLVGSSDVSSLVISLYPAEYIMVDYGHIDLFVADNALSLVWMPVLDWINDHSCSSNKGGFGWKKDD